MNVADKSAPLQERAANAPRRKVAAWRTDDLDILETRIFETAPHFAHVLGMIEFWRKPIERVEDGPLFELTFVEWINAVVIRHGDRPLKESSNGGYRPTARLTRRSGGTDFSTMGKSLAGEIREVNGLRKYFG